jgi:hypothetical protein
MAHDFKHKEPSKTEKMIYELVMNQQSMEKGLWSTSTLAIIMGILNDVEPEKIAELMVNGDDKIKEYSKKINEAIKKLEEAKGDKQPAAHDHSHEGHIHDHGAEASVEPEVIPVDSSNE